MKKKNLRNNPLKKKTTEMQKHIYFCSFFPIPKKKEKKKIYIYINHAHPFKHGFVKGTIEGKILT
jgi:hypothetical protein